VSYPWGLSFRPPVLSSIALFVAAIAGCDGALQFSESSAATGTGGQSNDAARDALEPIDAADAPAPDSSNDGDELRDALDTSVDRGMGSAPPCDKDIDCPSAKLHCDILTHQCVECIATADCVVAPYLRCDTSLQRCVECITSNDCDPNATCHPGARICIAACADAAACPMTAPFCDGRGSCASCRTNADCFREDLCDLAIGRCAFCADDRDCPAATPHCDPYNPGRARCKECLVPADCPPGKPFCDVHAGLCIAGP
jgi:hypothetical protein